MELSKIDKKKTLNKRYYENNREEILNKSKEYYINNRVKCLAYKKNYYDEHYKKEYAKKSIINKCECGEELTKHHLARHKKSQIHKDLIKMNGLD